MNKNIKGQEVKAEHRKVCGKEIVVIKVVTTFNDGSVEHTDHVVMLNK
jgi:hypothetical protein